MSYKVIHYFTDLQDFNHPYNVGDAFPRIGMNVSQERLDELAGSKNKQGKPLIQKIEEIKDDFSKHMSPTVENELKNYTKTDINRMPASELKSLALKNGIDGANDMTGADLKKALIEKFNL